MINCYQVNVYDSDGFTRDLYKGLTLEMCKYYFHHAILMKDWYCVRYVVNSDNSLTAVEKRISYV